MPNDFDLNKYATNLLNGGPIYYDKLTKVFVKEVSGWRDNLGKLYIVVTPINNKIIQYKIPQDEFKNRLQRSEMSETLFT